MLFEAIRNLLCPFDQIEKHVPKSGSILDVGCGHGIFSVLLTSKSAEREVLGIDPAEDKIIEAKKHVLPNLAFKKAFLEEVDNQKYDAIVVVDVLYLFPEEEKLNFLINASKKLKKSGRLILVINGAGNNLFFKLLDLEEFVMVKLFKKTYTIYNGLFFRDKVFYKNLLEKAGFSVQTQKDLKSKLNFPPHVLFVASPKTN